MPLVSFLFLLGVFLIGTLANMAGNAYGNYMSVLAVIVFAGWMFAAELKAELSRQAGGWFSRAGSILNSFLLAAYLMVLAGLAVDWAWGTILYLAVALLLIVFRAGQTLLAFFRFLFRKTTLRRFGNQLVFSCIDVVFMAQVFMEEMQIMDMSGWRLYSQAGFILMNVLLIVLAWFEKGGFASSLKKRYPMSLGLAFYLLTIAFTGYQSASDAGYVPRLYYAIFHSPETCFREAVFLREKDFEALTVMKFNLSSFWNRHAEAKGLMSRHTPFVTTGDCRMSLRLDLNSGITWDVSDLPPSSDE